MANTNIPKNVAMQASDIPAQVAGFGGSKRKTLTIEAVLYLDTGEVRMTPGEEHTYTRKEVTQWANSVVQHAIENNGNKIVQGAEGSSLRVLTNLMHTPTSGNLRSKQTYTLLNQAVASGWVLSRARKSVSRAGAEARTQAKVTEGTAYYALNVPGQAFPSARKAANASLKASNPKHTGLVSDLPNFKVIRAEARENMVVQGADSIKEAINNMSAKQVLTYAKEAGAPTSIKTKAAAVAYLLG
jgi:hypothetical protein